MLKKKVTMAVAVMALMLAFTPTSPAFERHPQIHEAIEALRHAKEHLEHANHDFKGHRVDAIRAVDEAIHQLQACMEADRD